MRDMAYVHEPLPDFDSLRLLRIDGLDDDDLHCSMRVAAIGNDIEYTALSYCWGMNEDGDATPCERIFIDGLPMAVTRNLYHGLRRICAKLGTLKCGLIWIDAVCINQSNIPERTAQVARMADIYSNAAEVIAWLGEGSSQAMDDNMTVLLECLAQPRHHHFREHEVLTEDGDVVSMCMAHATAETGFFLESSPSEPFQGKRLKDSRNKATRAVLKDSFDVEDVRAPLIRAQKVIRAFLGRRYWLRRWVIQEIYHAKRSPRLLWADQETTFSQLSDAYMSIFDLGLAAVGPGCEYRSTNSGPLESEIGAYILMTLHSARRINYRGILTSQLAISGVFECSDPRDRLYALLSLDPKSDFRPDYSLTTDQVYIAYFLHLMETEYCLPPLLESASSRKTSSIKTSEQDDGTATPPDLWRACPEPGDDITRKLPSWCFDLRKKFRVLRPCKPLGPWSVNKERHLSCSALVAGTLYSDPRGNFGGITPGAEFISTELLAPDIEPGTRVRYMWQTMSSVDYGQPGDLVCFFEDLEDRPFRGEELYAIIARPLDVGGVSRIAGSVTVYLRLGVWFAVQDRFVRYGVSQLPQLQEREGYLYSRTSLCLC